MFLMFILPAFARFTTNEQKVWNDFWSSSGAVLVLYTLWPPLRWGSLCLRLGGVVLCLLPLWILVWVIMERFGIHPG
jgi:hypothetical protein